MRDRVRQSPTALAVTPYRAAAMSLPFILTVGLLYVTLAGSSWPVETGWTEGVRMAVLVGSLAVAGLLAAMVRLLVLDWWAEIRSRAEWAALAVEAATAALPEDLGQSEHLYQPAVCDEGVHAVLRAHRHAVPRHVAEPLAEIGRSHGPGEKGPSLSAAAHQNFAALSVGHGAPPLPGRVDSGNPADALEQTMMATDGRLTRQATAVVHWLGAVSARRSKRQAHDRVRITTCVRHLVNDCTGHARTRPDSTLRVGVRIKIVSNILVRCPEETPPSDGKLAFEAELRGRPNKAGPCTRIAALSASSRARLRRNENGRRAMAASADTPRQSIALPEALAARVACERDAAEHVQQRSRSPPVRTITSPRCERRASSTVYAGLVDDVGRTSARSSTASR